MPALKVIPQKKIEAAKTHLQNALFWLSFKGPLKENLLSGKII